MDPTQAVDLGTRVISNLGFPIFVAVWMLVRTDKMIRDLSSAINRLSDVLGQPHNGAESRISTRQEV